MSDEQQQQQQQQQQQRQQSQHHAAGQLQVHSSSNNNNNSNTKIGKNNNNGVDSTTSTSTGPPRKSNIHEMRNQEFVSRLMAATPPYLYSAPVGPNNFFFSDMLRSLVQARNNETARNLQLQQAALARRPRKRPWSNPHRAYYEQHLRDRKEAEERQQMNGSTNEKPLELTTNKPYYHLAHKYRKLDETIKEMSLKQQSNSNPVKSSTELQESTTVQSNSASPNSVNNISSSSAGGGGGGGAVDATLQNNTPPAASLPPQDLVLPPPPPIWYPPLYPPYGIDPLHFFIDLRVSGHIYDRKKDNVSPLANASENGATNPDTDSPNPSALNLPNKHRHGSAFTVPVPRSNHDSKAVTLHNPNDVINLSSNTVSSKFEHYAKYYDLGETKENQPFLKSNTSASYMLQHLPRLYSQFAARDLMGQHMEQNDFTNNNNNNSNTENLDNADNKSEEADCDADSTDGRVSNDAVDVEIIDSIKYRNSGDANDGDSSRCSSGDDASITQID